MASRILLADDSITIQKVVNLTFADEGIEVIAVSNGEIAQRRLPEVNPDLVLADIFMPGRNGYELCEYIKGNPQFRHIPVVLLVGAFEPFDPSEARRVQADHHLTKPFESRTLVDTVRKLIGKGGRPATGPLSSSTPAESERSAQSIPETRPLTPPLNFDLSAMTDEPPASNQQFGFPEPREQMPTPAQPASSPEEDFGFDFGSLTQPASVSASEPTSQPAASESTSEAFDFGFPEQVAPAVTAAENGVGTPARGRAVPSAFGGIAQDVVLDFEMAETPAASPSVPDGLFDAEASTPAANPFSNAFDFSQEVLEAPAVETPAASASQAGSTAAVGDLESLDETGFSFSELTEVEAAASTLLGAEEPLGDLLMDEGAEPEVASDVFAEEVQAGFEPHAANEFVAPDLPHGSNGGYAAFGVGNIQAEFQPTADSHDEPALESFADEVSAESERLDAAFTSSEMWSSEGARFAPIDVEAVAVDETPPTIGGGEDFDEPETGFAFQAADAEEALAEEEAFPTVERQPAPALAGQTGAATGSLPPEVIDEIVRRVVAQLGETVVREIAWEVVPDCVERIVESLTRDSLTKRF